MAINVNGETITGTSGDDTLAGTGKNDWIEGLGGRDEIDGKSGQDQIFGGDDKDVLKGGAGNDSIEGGALSDLLLGGSGNDSLFGGSGNDEFRGGDGNDFIDPGTNISDDEIFGGKGDDIVDFSSGAGSKSLYIITYEELSDDLSITVGSKKGTVDKGSKGTDSLQNILDIGGGGSLVLIGGSGNDFIKGNLSTGRFLRLVGGDGDDEIVGGNGFDQLSFMSNGSNGATVTVTGYKNGQMQGTATDAFGGSDTFRNINEINGTDGDDTFTGSLRHDRFVYSAGDDTYDGRASNSDLIRYDRGVVDRIDADLSAGSIVVKSGSQTYTNTVSSIEWLRGSPEGNDTMTGDGDGNRLTAYAGDDVIKGRNGDDTLSGGKGRDEINGHDGRDELYGENGSDVLSGGNNADLLAGGAGFDKMTGGAGADTFQFTSGDGKKDKVKDFEDGKDMFHIVSGASSFSDLTIKHNSGDATVAFDDVKFTVLNTGQALLTEADFVFG